MNWLIDPYLSVLLTKMDPQSNLKSLSDPKSKPPTPKQFLSLICRFGLCIQSEPNYSSDHLPVCCHFSSLNILNERDILVSSKIGNKEIRLEQDPNNPNMWVIVLDQNSTREIVDFIGKWIDIFSLIEIFPLITTYLHGFELNPEHILRNMLLESMAQFIPSFLRLNRFIRDNCFPEEIFVLIVKIFISSEKWDSVGISLISY